MNRRDFIIGSGAGVGVVWHGSNPSTASAAVAAGGMMSEPSEQGQRTYHVLGVPLRSGSLYPGNENDAQAYRDVQLLARL